MVYLLQITLYMAKLARCIPKKVKATLSFQFNKLKLCSSFLEGNQLSNWIIQTIRFFLMVKFSPLIYFVSKLENFIDDETNDVTKNLRSWFMTNTLSRAPWADVMHRKFLVDNNSFMLHKTPEISKTNLSWVFLANDWLQDLCSLQAASTNYAR